MTDDLILLLYSHKTFELVNSTHHNELQAAKNLQNYLDNILQTILQRQLAISGRLI